jgi:hypothetical protein
LPTPLTSTGCKTSRFPNAAGAKERVLHRQRDFSRRKQFATHYRLTRYDSTPKNRQCKTLQIPTLTPFCTHDDQMAGAKLYRK